ncbi:hypothetical protein M9H77_22198 [Catharanthus roseus]|uniref:Uncharacterized protein n=1 Tax=Catharanthus roseus TaxID=4058 RepID=A0ACC0APT9_CATRO|nr:hypothetical protein M9H77_22198 [Catharanthus roseus]
MVLLEHYLMGEKFEEGGSSRGGRKGKGKIVATGVGAPERFISVTEAANFEEWKRKRRKIAPGHKVDLSDMECMEIIPNLFEDIGWGPLLSVNILYYPKIIYEFYVNLHKGSIQKQGNITYNWVTSRVGGRDISFDDRLLNHILGTPQNGIRFYTKNKKCFDPNLYSERRFEEIFTKGEVLKRHDDRNVNKLDAYEILLQYMISNIVIPNVGHKFSITNMHSFVMLVLHEHRRMNFGYMAIEHMLATQTSSTKCFPYGCFLTRVFQYFVLSLVGVGDPIGARKIYNKHTFKRMGFAKNEEGMLVRGGQDDNDESDRYDEDDEGNKEQETKNLMKRKVKKNRKSRPIEEK